METNVTKKRMQRLIVAILTVALVLTTFSLMPVASQIANPDSDNGIAYAAAKKVKVTYKANGGKFTAKKYAKKKSYSKKVKKGKKIGALPKIKRSGYTLKGWYTKKSGGKKVTKNTKVKKNTTYYAQWKKKNRKLNAYEKKLVGVWSNKTFTQGYDKIIYQDASQIVTELKKGGFYATVTTYKADGTGYYLYVASTGYGWTTWNWRADKDKIYITNGMGTNDSKTYPYTYKNKPFTDMSNFYKITTNSEGKLQYTEMYNNPKGNEQTIDEFIKYSYPEWLTKVD